MEKINNDIFQHLGKESFTWFLSWYLWVQITLNDEIMKQYFVLSKKKIKLEKRILFDEIYNKFLKLQLTRFYGAKSKTHYLHKQFLKQKFDEMIKAAMTRNNKVYIK